MRPTGPCLLTLLLAAGAPLTAAASQAETGALFPEDRRLAARATASAPSTEVQQILSALSREHSVRLEAAQDARWERATVYARDLPLRQVMEGLQELLGGAWLASGAEGRRRYTLSPSVRTQQLEKALAWESVQRGAALLFRMPSYLSRPAEHYARVEQEFQRTKKQPADPILRFPNVTYLAASTPRAGIQLLGTLTPEQRVLLVTDERYLLRWAAMSEVQRRLALELARAIGRARARFGERRGERPEEMEEWVRRFGLVLSVKSHPVTGAITAYAFGEGGAQTSCAALPAAMPDLEILPRRGRPYDRRRPGDRPPTYRALADRPFPAKFRQDDLHRKTWAGVMERLAAVTALPLFSDDHAGAPAPGDRAGRPLPDLGKLKLPEALDALCDYYRCLWWYDGGALFFRSRSWYIERLYQVPPPVSAALRSQLEKRGKLDAAALDMLSRLTTRQLVGLNAAAGLEAGALAAPPNGSREYRMLMGRREARVARGYLWVWSRLAAAQKEALLRGTSLPVARLTPAQQQAFFELLATEYGPDMVRDPARLGYRVEQSVSSARPEPLPGLPPEPPKRLIAHLTFHCRERRENESAVAERLSIGFAAPKAPEAPEAPKAPAPSGGEQEGRGRRPVHSPAAAVRLDERARECRATGPLPRRASTGGAAPPRRARSPAPRAVSTRTARADGARAAARRIRPRPRNAGPADCERATRRPGAGGERGVNAGRMRAEGFEGSLLMGDAARRPPQAAAVVVRDRFAARAVTHPRPDANRLSSAPCHQDLAGMLT